MLKSLTILAVLFAVALAPIALSGQAIHAGVSTPAVAASPAGSPSAESRSREAGSEDSSSDQRPQPHISVVTAPPTVAMQPWGMREWVAWVANLVLVVLGYYGIFLGVRTLKSIDTHIESAEATAQAALDAAKAVSAIAQTALDGVKTTSLIAQAAADTAHAASLSAQAIVNSERPWMLISVEPSREVKNQFRIMAFNRGRTPAEVIASTDQIGLAVDENYLPKTPEYSSKDSGLLPTPIILLPGESMVVQPFGRDDLKWVCKTPERLRQVELWQNKIFIHGKLTYRDLIASPDRQLHETHWCCRYVHGESSSDLVMSGPLEYNKHT
jgi:hypothetical protein